MNTEPARPSPSALRWRVFPAVAIIAIGLLFLANNLGYNLVFLDHGNWWALIILLAAIAPLTRAWEVYRARGRVDAETAYFLLSAGAIVLVAVMFLANLDWAVWWPLFVILGGLYTLVPYRRHCRSRYAYRDHDDDAAVKH
ncbi:MAG: LiaF transmembrane domain-containing protein [Rhodanobacteraceae bacterium]